MTDPHNNDLLKRCPKQAPTWKVFGLITLGWAAAIALATMGSVSFLSVN
jgi:hypothetical protein